MSLNISGIFNILLNLGSGQGQKKWPSFAQPQLSAMADNTQWWALNLHEALLPKFDGVYKIILLHTSWCHLASQGHSDLTIMMYLLKIHIDKQIVGDGFSWQNTSYPSQ